jgi:hypothetical protein
MDPETRKFWDGVVNAIGIGALLGSVGYAAAFWLVFWVL